jgi:hypothetical protein
MTLESAFEPSETTAAAVSSHDDSIPKISIFSPGGMSSGQAPHFNVETSLGCGI